MGEGGIGQRTAFCRTDAQTESVLLVRKVTIRNQCLTTGITVGPPTSAFVQTLHEWPQSFLIEDGALCVPLPQCRPGLLQAGHLRGTETSP